MNKHYYKSAGFTMIEMLIALLVLSIGLIGLAALQGRGQQFNHAAYVRTQAVFIAYDIMDRIRSNPRTGTSDKLYEKELPSDKDCPFEKVKDQCDGNTCSASQLAQYDLYNWCTFIQSTLPDGEANIVANDINTDGRTDYIITLKWAEDRDEDAEKKVQQWTLVN